MSYSIAGIQQMGIGIPNVHEAWAFYRRSFGMDVPIFEEAAEANLMLPYTGGVPHQRHAILALNMQGGGGFEIWQYTSREPQLPENEVLIGDLGIFGCIIKCRNIQHAWNHMKKEHVEIKSEIIDLPNGIRSFWVKDPFNNYFQLRESDSWLSDNGCPTGGVGGAVIGVRDIEKSIQFYSDILGYDRIDYEIAGVLSDLTNIPGGNSEFKRVCLSKSKAAKGAFHKLLGSSVIELVQVRNRQPKAIFENRFWGDRGFIHLCFDIHGMQNLREKCKSSNHPFTVDSSDSFDMGEAAGHFSYIEDPDGTLIEFVETHKIPILKKIGWYLDLRKRNPEKALPNFMLKALSLNRKKD